MRLRQIVTNLASNACKFTPSGGTLTIKTKLILPGSSDHPYTHHTHGHYRRTRTVSMSEVPSKDKEKEARDRATSRASDDPPHSHSNGKTVHHKNRDYLDLEKGDIPELSTKCLDQHNATHQKKHLLDKIVVRIEISDTGFGIKSKDMAKGKLFCRYSRPISHTTVLSYVQLLSIRQNKVASKEEKVPGLAWLSSVKSSGSLGDDWVCDLKSGSAQRFGLNYVC